MWTVVSRELPVMKVHNTMQRSREKVLIFFNGSYKKNLHKKMKILLTVLEHWSCTIALVLALQFSALILNLFDVENVRSQCETAVNVTMSVTQRDFYFFLFFVSDSFDLQLFGASPSFFFQMNTRWKSVCKWESGGFFCEFNVNCFV